MVDCHIRIKPEQRIIFNFQCELCVLLRISGFHDSLDFHFKAAAVGIASDKGIPEDLSEPDRVIDYEILCLWCKLKFMDIEQSLTASDIMLHQCYNTVTPHRVFLVEC